MRSKLALAMFVLVSTFPAMAQVAPAAKIHSLPLGVGGGVSDYDLDYGQGRRMLGASAWVDYDLFHGLGIQAEGTDIFADKPSTLTRMKQETVQGGAIYKYHAIKGFRPFVTGEEGVGKIEFPSHNPFYTSDTYLITSIGGGVEYKVWRTLSVRGDYEYQIWHDFRTHSLTPQGFTIGATYYLHSPHRHY